MIYVLLLFFLLIGIISFIFLNKEIISPAVILCLVYIVSVICAIINIDKWDIQLHFNTFMIFIFGTCLFVLVSFILERIYRKKYNQQIEFNKKYFESETIVANYKIVGIVLFDVIILIVMFYYISKFAYENGNPISFSQILKVYREYTSYKSTEVAFPFLLRQLLKVLQLSGFIFLFIYIKNIIISRKNIIKKIYYLLPVLFTIIQSLLVSERLKILQIAAFSVFIYIFLWSQKNNWEKGINYKIYLYILVLFLLLMLGFYFIRLFIGRTSTEGLITYITRYAGGSIQLFDLFMQNPPELSDIWGKETFYYLNQNLYQFGFLKEMYVIHLEFRESNGVVLGNVYTAYRRWIYDFGIYGAMILQIFLAIIYNLWYQKLKLICTKSLKGEFLLFLYSYLIFTLFMHSIDSNFYRIVFCLGFVLTTIEMFLLFYFFLYFDEKKIYKFFSRR